MAFDVKSVLNAEEELHITPEVIIAISQFLGNNQAEAALKYLLEQNHQLTPIQAKVMLFINAYNNLNIEHIEGLVKHFITDNKDVNLKLTKYLYTKKFHPSYHKPIQIIDTFMSDFEIIQMLSLADDKSKLILSIASQKPTLYSVHAEKLKKEELPFLPDSKHIIKSVLDYLDDGFFNSVCASFLKAVILNDDLASVNFLLNKGVELNNESINSLIVEKNPILNKTLLNHSAQEGNINNFQALLKLGITPEQSIYEIATDKIKDLLNYKPGKNRETVYTYCQGESVDLEKIQDLVLDYYDSSSDESSDEEYESPVDSVNATLGIEQINNETLSRLTQRDHTYIEKLNGYHHKAAKNNNENMRVVYQSMEKLAESNMQCILYRGIHRGLKHYVELSNYMFNNEIINSIQKIKSSHPNKMVALLNYENEGWKFYFDNSLKYKEKNKIKDTLSPISQNSWYTNEQISALLKYYISDDEDVEILTAMLGTDWNNRNDLEINLIQFEQQRLVNIADGYLVSNKVIIPINLSQNHWVLSYLIYPPEGEQQRELSYFDPLGNAIPRSVQAAFSAFHFEEVNITSFSDTIQTDGINCGPWIIEAARCFVNNQQLPDISFDIMQARQKHIDDYNRLLKLQDKSLDSMTKSFPAENILGTQFPTILSKSYDELDKEEILRIKKEVSTLLSNQAKNEMISKNKMKATFSPEIREKIIATIQSQVNIEYQSVFTNSQITQILEDSLCNFRNLENNTDIADYPNKLIKFYDEYIKHYGRLFNLNEIKQFGFIDNPIISVAQLFSKALPYATAARNSEGINRLDPHYRRSTGKPKHRFLGCVRIYRLDKSFIDNFSESRTELFVKDEIKLNCYYKSETEFMIKGFIPEQYYYSDIPLYLPNINETLIETLIKNEETLLKKSSRGKSESRGESESRIKNKILPAIFNHKDAFERNVALNKVIATTINVRTLDKTVEKSVKNSIWKMNQSIVFFQPHTDGFVDKMVTHPLGKNFARAKNPDENLTFSRTLLSNEDSKASHELIESESILGKRKLDESQTLQHSEADEMQSGNPLSYL